MQDNICAMQLLSTTLNWQLLMQDFHTETQTLFRPVVINQVLGTDMKKHFDILSRFQVHSLLFVRTLNVRTLLM